MRHVPQPAVDRMVDFSARPLVVGVVPDLPQLVALTALSLARAAQAPALHFAYADPTRYVVTERPDGTLLWFVKPGVGRVRVGGTGRGRCSA